MPFFPLLIIITLTTEESKKFKSYVKEDFSDIECISVEDLTQYTNKQVQTVLNNKSSEQSLLIKYDNYKRILQLNIEKTSKEKIYELIEEKILIPTLHTGLFRI